MKEFTEEGGKIYAEFKVVKDTSTLMDVITVHHGGKIEVKDNVVRIIWRR